MIGVTPQPTAPVVVASTPKVLTQTRKQENLSTDFIGAAHRAGGSGDLGIDWGMPPIGPEYGRLPVGGPSGFPGLELGGAPRDTEPLGRHGRFPAPPPWSDSPQTGQSKTREVWYPWDHGCSSPTSPAPGYATVDVFADVPVRIQFATAGSSALRQGSSRRIPADYSQHVVTGGDQGRRPVAATRYDLADYGAAPPHEDHIDEPTQKFLSDWSKAITEGVEPCNQLFSGIIEKSVAAAEERVHAALEKALIMMLGKLAEHLRMPTLEKLLTQPKDSTLDLVEKHLPDIGKVIPEKDKKALTDLLESVGIKWPKVFG